MAQHDLLLSGFDSLLIALLTESLCERGGDTAHTDGIDRTEGDSAERENAQEHSPTHT